jgi:hypothetical protein
VERKKPGKPASVGEHFQEGWLHPLKNRPPCKFNWLIPDTTVTALLPDTTFLLGHSALPSQPIPELKTNNRYVGITMIIIIMFGGVGVEFRALCLTGRHFTT